MNLGQYLDQTVERYGDRPYLFFEEESISYHALGERVNRLAHALQAAGVRRGEMIQTLLPNCPEALVCYFAIQKIGAVAGPINVQWKPPEVEHLLQDSRARGMIVHHDLAGVLEPIRARCPDLELVIELGGAPRPGHLDFAALLAGGSPEPFSCTAAPEDPAYIFYTSGTTGSPKGVLLSHRNVLADIRSFQEAARLDEGYRILIFLPLFHVNAMLTATSTLDRGGAVVLRRGFSAGEFWEVVERYRVSFWSAVPAVYSILLADPGRQQHDLSSLQFGICGAAPMPVETLRAFECTFGIPIVEGYGLTEGTCVSTLNPVQGVRKVGSIGLPCPGQEVFVVDEAGQRLPPGEVGEIVVRGEVVMLGYHNRPEETARALAGGVLHTGDLGRVDEEGYLFIVDRLKDMVIRGGENIYPKEIDNVLAGHPAVREAACIGVPDPVRGEELAAFVILKEGTAASEEELWRFCGERLADYKVPRYIQIIARDFPRNAVGKIMKKEMRQWSVAEARDLKARRKA